MPFIHPSSRLLFAGLALGLLLLFQWPTNTSSWILLACWPLGVLFFAYMARVYLAPYVLMRCSSHIRVRSVSLRSIRDLYFRKGNWTWRIDRFGYSYRSSTDDGPRRLSFRIEGFKLEIEPPPAPRPPPPRATHKRGLTLADLSPSPLALYLWSVISRLYAVFDPAVRPIIRFVVHAALQQIIRFIPRLTETVQVDIDQAVVSYVGSPQVQLIVQDVAFRGHVSFVQSPQTQPIRDDVPSYNQTLNARALAMGAWKSRLSAGFRRAWTRTWNDTLGRMTASISYDLEVRRIHGFIPSDGIVQMGMSESGTILRSPESFLVSGSARFSPRDGAVESRSVQNHIKVGAIHVDADNLQRWWSHFKNATENNLVPPPSSLSTATSPWLKSPFSASSVTSDVRVQILTKRRKQRVKPLDLIMVARFDVDSVTVSQKIGCHKFNVVFKAATCSCEPSDATANFAHCAWPGKELANTSRAILFRLKLQGISLHRASGVARSNSPILRIGSTSVEATLSDWPSILSVDPHLCCDAKLPSIFLGVQVASVLFADRHDMLLSLISELNSLNNVPDGNSGSLLPNVISPVPWISASATVGRISACVICADIPGVEEPYSVELETQGMIFTSSTNFHIGVTSTRPLTLDGNLPFCMSSPFTFFLYPLFLRLRANSSNTATRRMSRWGVECTNNETLFSIEAVEVEGTLTGLGEAHDDEQCLCATLDTRSVFVDLHCCTEAGIIELWHPERLRVLSVLLSLLSARCPSSKNKPSGSTKFPSGCALSFSVARFVLFVTGSDINPDADNDITRGVAFSTGFSLRYCSINARQRHALPHSQQYSQNRAKLLLPTDIFADPVLLEKIFVPSGTDAVAGKLILWNTTVRAAAADRFSMDDPRITERDSPLLDTKQLISVKGINLDAKFTAITSLNSAGAACDMTFSVDDTLIYLELGLIYSILLALRTIQTIHQCATPSRDERSSSYSAHSIVLNIQGTIKALRMRFRSMDQTAVARINYLNVVFTPQNARCSINSLLVWVPVNQRRSVMKAPTAGVTWEELGRLHRCTLSLPPSLKGPILVDSDSLRIRIPSGYVFAELQLAAVVTIKAVKHLVSTVRNAKFVPIPTPEAESAKLVPDLTFSCRLFCFEAADDPFESQLGLNFRAGLAAARTRLHREEAFDAKATVVMGNPTTTDTSVVNTDYQFSGDHSVSVQDARQRLNLAHSLDWITRHRQHTQERVAQEELVHRELHGAIPLKRPTKTPDLVKPAKPLRVPPLLRIISSKLYLRIQRPTFPPEHLPCFLQEQGGGIPHETCYTLLIPMHLNISFKALQVSLRDYPLPLLYIPSRSGTDESPSLIFDSNFVIAEEMGPPQSVDWISCSVIDLGDGFDHSCPLVVRIPKTLMPVKTYARPLVSVLTDQTTAFTWGVSYSPAIHDIVRVLDGLTPEARDPSPHLGFWDKLRLIFHWTIEISFKEEIRLYIKGSCDPYILDNDGAGFALCWQGEPQINIGSQNKDRELVQVASDSMSIIIPKFESVAGSIYAQGHAVARNDWVKLCAHLCSGVRFGVGALLERTCSPLECNKCTGSPFDRACRFFHFRPHYTVQLGTANSFESQVDHDSYRGFRSNFIHLSISITSALRQESKCSDSQPSSFHLTPKAFANFWSWWGLFDNGLSLPIRQGSLYPQRTPSPKFARHIATLKYRISIPELFITHAYIDDSRESWEDGTTTIVGLKAKVSHFQADMHQRDQETIAPGKVPDSIQVVRHKPFYAAEVVLRNVDLRAILAVFPDPLKQSVPLSANPNNSKKDRSSSGGDIPPSWVNSDDWVETDWSPTHHLPEIQLLPVLSCPKLTYLKKNSRVTEIQVENSKFGDEETHTCFLGSEPTVPQVEISLAEQRIAALQRVAGEESKSPRLVQRQYPLHKMVALLRDYIDHLKAVDQCPEDTRKSNVESYYMPAEMVSASEWADFENVYQVHSPNLFMCDAVRDLLMRYYNCSRARRGYEYHMASRAVKFIRDQAEIVLLQAIDRPEKSKASTGAAQVAASALRRMLTGGRVSTSLDIQTAVTSDPADVKPLEGLDEGVLLRKRHFCLLLKPQIILRGMDSSSSATTESVVILAAVQAKLQVFKIMDASNLEDPVSGHIMHRNYMSLDGLQTFCPAGSLSYNSGSVPLEVLLDYRCESDCFDRIVPQTNANCQYDRFNRLRLRNNVAPVAQSKLERAHGGRQAHLQNDTDLVHVHVPRFTVSANDRHFQFISNIITHLVLFSDVAHKARLEKLETLLFAYDFTDLTSAASVVSNLQSRLRSMLETHDDVNRQMRDNHPQTKLQILKLKAHIFLVVEELNLIFDAIRLAQSRTDGHSDHKSALLLQASSSEISWMMLDENRDLLAKLALRNIDFSWLSKQDSSTANRLTVGNLQAFDGSPNAVWTEIVSKYEEPSNHPLYKRNLFLDAEWTVLAPVGGIAIYEKFQLDFHPIRLQLDARLGQRIMEYIWPARRARNQKDTQYMISDLPPLEQSPPRSSLESVALLQKPRASLDSNRLAPSLRQLGPSRSFTDLRSAAAESSKTPVEPSFTRAGTPDINNHEDSWSIRKATREDRPEKDDAVEMKTRSSQKTFILVKISSVELLLSIMKAQSFECRDARIRTHSLEFRNQTWSFEELVDQFLPSDLTWRGWVRMAFHQPLVPVLPVARELFSKTKLIPSKQASQNDFRPPTKKFTLRGKKNTADATIRDHAPRRSSSSGEPPSTFALGDSLTMLTLADEPEPMEMTPSEQGELRAKHQQGRTRLLSVFSRGKSVARSLALEGGERRTSGDSFANVRGSTAYDDS